MFHASPSPAPPATLWVPWPRLARSHIAALLASEGPVRAAVVGPAGSGKTAVLTHLRRALPAAGRTAVPAVRGVLESDAAPGTVLLVDDAQLHDEAELRALLERAADPDASIVVAARPHPQPPLLTEVLDRLEHAHPVIVLGHLTAADLDDGSAGPSLPESCAAGILRLTGGLTWLVSESLSMHDSPCAGESTHTAIANGLADVVAHRVAHASPEVRHAVEGRCAGVATSEDDEQLDAAYAAGLLSRNGEPSPVVRSAVLATTPAERFLARWSETRVDDRSAAALMALPLGSRTARDQRLADGLVERADELLWSDPALAGDVYEQAISLGADAAHLAVRRAHAAWAAGDIDEAARIIEFSDAAPAGGAEQQLAVDLVASVWASRASMETAHLTYANAGSAGGVTAGAVVAAIGAMRPREAVATAEPRSGIPATSEVAMDLLDRGLRASVGSATPDAVGDLTRASSMYTVARRATPLPELPAVIAAVAALHSGDLDMAETSLRTALEGGQGGPGARDRLLLWSAWVALQRERPNDADGLLARVRAPRSALCLRERLVADAIAVAQARRYGDSATTAVAWHVARETVVHARFDLFTHLLLAEFVVTAARVGDDAMLTRHLDDALRGLDELGSPPLWSAHLHWAGIQRGILRNRPDDLKPHARALIAASPDSVPAARMARAGRVWTSVLTGDVDPAVVEEAAAGLAEVGLAWDGARLAGHGAGRTQDRRAIAQLLAVARRLHPREHPQSPDGGRRPGGPARSTEILSVREREVALLVLQGKTYVEIGETIFISPRTAEHHIARIRHRVGATSRSDLIAKLRLMLEDATEPDLLRSAQRESA